MTIYIHIPFCVRRCGYCDFYSSTELGLRERVLEGIEAEWVREKGWINESVETIYFGGGTPSLCEPEWFGRFLALVGGTPREVTVECNPDDLTADYLQRLRDQGVNRLSIGVQSFNDRDLRLMGRRHSAAAAKEAVHAAQKFFNNISIDLIFGVPGMTLDDWRANLLQALDLGVQHISAYHLTLEPDTPFGRSMTPIDDALSEEQFALLHDTLTAAGYEHYEVSNFALEGFRSRHNSAYWQGVPYLGLGPGAHSYNGLVRRSFAGTITDYLSGAPYIIEHLTEADRRNELLMTRLRTSEGIAAEHLTPRQAEPFISRGLLELHDGNYRIPAPKFLLSDIVIAGLFE